MMTELGGAVAVPSAVRNSDSTTTMRVNDVIITRIDGANDSTVSIAIIWITRSVRPAFWPRSTLMLCAAAGEPDARRRPVTPTATDKSRTRRSERPLKFYPVDGRADWPSLLRDYRRRSWPERPVA